MIIDLLKAIAFAGLPVAFFSYYFVTLTSKNVKLKSNNAKELQQELKNVKLNKDNNFVRQALQKKFLKFGGGFYGIMAFITYLHIEAYQVYDFVRKFDGWQNFIDSIGFSMFINFFIEAIMNLVTAFVWFFYWFKYLPIGSFWLWLIVVIFAHTITVKFVLTKTKKQLET